MFPFEEWHPVDDLSDRLGPERLDLFSCGGELQPKCGEWLRRTLSLAD